MNGNTLNANDLQSNSKGKIQMVVASVFSWSGLGSDGNKNVVLGLAYSFAYDPDLLNHNFNVVYPNYYMLGILDTDRAVSLVTYTLSSLAIYWGCKRSVAVSTSRRPSWRD